MKKIDLSGGIITNYMLKLLNNNGLNFSNQEKLKVRNIKEKACYVALDFKDSIKSIEPFYYELPDGNKLFLKNKESYALKDYSNHQSSVRVGMVLLKPVMI